MSVLELEQVSRWFGNVVAVNDVSMTLGPGVTGLLGPNGAGKSTLINMMSGFLPPSSGSVTLDGEPVWHREQVYRSIGLVPETEAVMQGITGWGFVVANARLQGLPDPEAAALAALDIVDMTDVKDRTIGTYSKGMRQRVKLASALVHDPPVLLLDEPFNGMDPRQRLHLMGVLSDLANAGRTVIFSSHILEEVEELAQTIQVMVAGRHAASGDFREIRRLMIERPIDTRCARRTIERWRPRCSPPALCPRSSSRPKASRCRRSTSTSWHMPSPSSRVSSGSGSPRSLRTMSRSRASSPIW